jgi:hypothetical protein
VINPVAPQCRRRIALLLHDTGQGLRVEAMYLPVLHEDGKAHDSGCIHRAWT